jgi:hypothetical protein
MHLIISPSKTLDMSQREIELETTLSPFLDKSQSLVSKLSRLKPSDIQLLMKVSPKIGELNEKRFNEWHTPFTKINSKPAIFAFKGDVYSGLDADSMSYDQIEFAQKSLSILSGLYGLLRPLDLMQAYRLEMGINLPNNRGKNLYKFWGNQLTNELNRREKTWLINLASSEYFKSIKVDKLSAKVIQPIFKDKKNGVLKIIGIHAKKARGMMSRFVIENKIQNPENLKYFNQGGYAFCESISSENYWVFTR